VPEVERQPLAHPIGVSPKKWKPSLHRRVFERVRRLWSFAIALAGVIPAPRIRTVRDVGPTRLAYRARQWWRWVAAFLLPTGAYLWLYDVGRHMLATTDLDALLRAILPAASLTSGLLAAGLMTATAQAKELRRRRVDALRECQKELQPVRRAFDMLEIGFHKRPNKGEHLTRFLERVHWIGFEWNVYDGSDTGGRLMRVEKLNDIVDALEELSGTLTRPKHYRFLVEELGGGVATDVSSLHGVVLTTWQGVMNAVDSIRPDAVASGSWQYLSFWEDLINDTLELASRARGLSVEVHYQNLTRLRAMFAHLAWLVVVGVAVPLVAVAFTTSPRVKAGLAMVAVGGMLMLLASSWFCSTAGSRSANSMMRADLMCEACWARVL
jgi:hypothetical protein